MEYNNKQKWEAKMFSLLTISDNSMLLTRLLHCPHMVEWNARPTPELFSVKCSSELGLGFTFRYVDCHLQHVAW